METKSKRDVEWGDPCKKHHNFEDGWNEDYLRRNEIISALFNIIGLLIMLGLAIFGFWGFFKLLLREPFL